ncbi:homeodomain-interacting protein kinase 1-like [Scomber scombrus]|uniref:Homeodomain-interacting protein kinase 1-like n=1 Tax=Scomber scombrus TaxID=13677 RepID=A0AAV1P1V4_SCOSC
MFKITMKRIKHPPNMSQLPKNYELVTVLGKGVFGEVLKCIKVDTKDTVAVKMPRHGCNLTNELRLFKYFKKKKLHDSNIIRFIDSFKLRDKRRALVFEVMEMTLKDFLMEQRDYTPLYLQEVRSIIQQLANALKALKAIKVIHVDIKLDNIMLNVQPLTVKLIDFGLAFYTRKVKQGDILQVAHYRAPEIMLGLPYSEAIDMWSLGVVMGYITLGDSLFPGYCDYDTTHEEYWGKHILSHGRKTYTYHNLDEVEYSDLVNMKMVSIEEKRTCINLLKRMLQLDAKVRITPIEVLAHPFITWSTQQHTSCHETLKYSSSQGTEPRTSKAPEPGTIQELEPRSSEAPEPGTTQAAEEGTSQALKDSKVNDSTIGSNHLISLGIPPGVILVKSAPPECCFRLEEDSRQQSDTCHETFITSQADKESEVSTTILPGVILVRSAPPECCLRWDEDSGHQSDTCSSSRRQRHPERIMYQEDTATASDDERPEQKKRKRNCLKRFCSVMKRTFCCSVRVDTDEG